MQFRPNDPARALAYFEDKLAFTTGPAELARALEEGGGQAPLVVDVRDADDFAREHIPGSINVPRDGQGWKKARGLQPGKLHVVVCYSQVCHLAAKAAVELAKGGFSVMELEGGFKAWREHRLPVESSLPREGAEGGEHAKSLTDPPGYETLEERSDGPHVVH
jgi:rhodanese-related sulfurtransferase